MKVKTGAICGASKRRTRPGKLSGLAAFDGFRSASSFSTPGMVTVKLAMVGYFVESPLSGTWVRFSLVKTELK